MVGDHLLEGGRPVSLVTAKGAQPVDATRVGRPEPQRVLLSSNVLPIPPSPRSWATAGPVRPTALDDVREGRVRQLSDADLAAYDE